MGDKENVNMGHIEVIFGPMFSGKSTGNSCRLLILFAVLISCCTELLRRIRRYTVANHRCLVVKYKNDTRYSEESLSTHDR